MIDTTFLKKCIHTLEKAYTALQNHTPQDSVYDIYRAACVKEFELILEQSGKLLKKKLRPYFASNKMADQLSFKDIFRYAAKHSLIDIAACERWLLYRDNRNSTAHDYGESFAEKTLTLLPNFISDAQQLTAVIDTHD